MIRWRFWRRNDYAEVYDISFSCSRASLAGIAPCRKTVRRRWMLLWGRR